MSYVYFMILTPPCAPHNTKYPFIFQETMTLQEYKLINELNQIHMKKLRQEHKQEEKQSQNFNYQLKFKKKVKIFRCILNQDLEKYSPCR